MVAESFLFSLGSLFLHCLFHVLLANFVFGSRRVLANPEKPPAIDWATYKAKIAIPGLVDAFQKEYESLQIAYPADKVTPLVDAQQAEAVSFPQQGARLL